MHLVPFHKNRAEWAGGAEVLAGTAAYALVLVNSRNLHCAVRAFVVYHLDSSCRAVTCAVAAADTVGQHHAIVLDPYGISHMDICLLLTGNGLDGTGRADLAAAGAFGTAVAALKRHDRLHEVLEVIRGA